MFRFDEKVVIVTGGSLGIGAAASEAFAAAGGSVIIASRQAPAAEALAVSISDSGGAAVHIATDVADEGDVVRLVEQTLARFGRLDVLVNNAGIHMTGDAIETTLDDWNRIMAVNLTSAFLCTKHAAEPLARTRGAIVNVSSEAGLVGIRNQVAYNVSKAAMIELTKSCAVDFAPRGIRVNCVCPGTTATPLVEELVARAPDPAAARRQWESIRPMNRLGTTSEIASAILYLASEEAGYATGAVLAVDGGYTAQ
jgi:NAD(P)-dependent dehydrogenase (short-subunit alcohol dehydrogenase family)